MRSTTATRARWAAHRRRSWATSSSSTCSPRRVRETSRRKTPRTTRPSGSNATTPPDRAGVVASNAPAYRAARPIPARRRLVFRLADDRNVLGVAMMVPAAAFLLVFLAYPLGLGFWLGMTDASIGQPGRFIGLGNFVSLARDQIFWLSVFNTLLYTVVASAVKFGLGLYLALL